MTRDISLFVVYKSPARCHYILHTGPLKRTFYAIRLFICQIVDVSVRLLITTNRAVLPFDMKLHSIWLVLQIFKLMQLEITVLDNHIMVLLPWSLCITCQIKWCQHFIHAYRFSGCSKMEMAESSLTASTIIWGTRGLMALTSRGIPSSDSSMDFRPY